MATTITHKVRNPIYNETNYISNTTQDQRWLNIWNANIIKNGSVVNYTITPSDNWEISGEQITGSISVTKVIDNGNIHNVTTNTPAVQNALTKMDANGNLVSGPVIDNNGSITKFLNEKGEWVQPNIEGVTPIIIATPTNNNIKWTITHAIANDNWTTNQTVKLALNNNTILTINKYGHIIEKNDITIPEASSTSAGLAPKTNTSDAGKILKVNSDGSIAWTTIPIVSDSTDGLTPTYGNNASGKILSIDNNQPAWLDPTTTIPTVTVNKNGLAPGFSTNDIGKILTVSSNGNSTSWTQLDIKDTPKYFYLVYNAWDINHEGLSPDNVYNTNQDGGGCLSFIFSEAEPPTELTGDEEPYYSEMYLSDTSLIYL